MRRRSLILAALLLCAGVPAAAQLTAVSATITDPKGLAYANGSVKAVLIVSGGASPSLNGVPFTAVVGPTSLDSTGSFTLNLADNNVVSPAGTRWVFTLCPQNLTPCATTAPLLITGASQSVTGTINAIVGAQISGFPVPFPAGGAAAAIKVYAPNITPVTVNNTNVETVLQSITVPANDLGASQYLLVHAAGVISYGAASTFQLQLRAGGLAGTVVATTGVQGISNFTNSGWSADIYIVASAAPGAAVPVESQGMMLSNSLTITSANSGFPFPMPNTATINLATNASQAYTFTILFGAAAAGNTITSRLMTIARYN